MMLKCYTRAQASILHSIPAVSSTLIPLACACACGRPPQAELDRQAEEERRGLQQRLRAAEDECERLEAQLQAIEAAAREAAAAADALCEQVGRCSLAARSGTSAHGLEPDLTAWCCLLTCLPVTWRAFACTTLPARAAAVTDRARAQPAILFPMLCCPINAPPLSPC